jgi:sterol desaturase/sphingolipid hydroxylase (fatty acid hydroxylase superfamily)
MTLDPITPAFSPVTYAVPLFVLLILGEIAFARIRRKGDEVGDVVYEATDTRTSLLMGLGSNIIGTLTVGLSIPAILYAWEHRLFDIPMTAIWAWVLLFFLEDFTYYWFHRLAHERRFWWASHVNHHSSQHYNLSTALRQQWTGNLSGTWLLWLPLGFLGFPPAMIAIQGGVSLVYQFWIHTEVIGKMPRWFEAVFNTPSHHRVHHARNPRYLDSNYAGILIIWDRLFGTFVNEEQADPCRYGIVRNLGDFNILRVAFHEWAGLFKDVLSARSPREVIGYLFGPPGWSPDGSRQTSKMLKAQWQGTGSKVISDPIESI